MCAWGGIAFLGLAYFMGGFADSGWIFFSQVLYLGGFALTGCGTYMYGRGKGYAPSIGLLGLLGPLGLGIVFMMKDHSGLILKRRARERRS